MKSEIETALLVAGISSEAVVDAGNGDFLIASATLAFSKNRLANAHGGYEGKSLIEKIRDDLDEKFSERDQDIDDSFCEGMCHALGILRSTDADVEWENAKNRFEESQA